MTFSHVAIFFLAGFLGSIPFGLIVTRALGMVDPRGAGSKNIGATNVLRTSGWGSGLLTLAGDIAKGAFAVGILPVFIAHPQEISYISEIAAAGAVLGHMYSPFIGFRGGKGVATGLGVFAILMPAPTIVAVLVFLATVSYTQYISFGSILASLAIPISGILMGFSAEKIYVAILIGALVIWRHKENIHRLWHGEENRFRSRP